MNRQILCVVVFLLGTTMSVLADFHLIQGGKSASICYLGQEQVVRTAIEMYVEDCRLVCGNKAPLVEGMSDSCIVVGVIGEGTDFDVWLKRSKTDVSDMVGRWEAFKIIPVIDRGKNFLLVVGSDPRGTAFGVLELSRRIGVSPWVWWADVVPEKRQEVAIATGEKMIQFPSVQYRGIFLNDEDWGLRPWSSRTYEPSLRKGEIGVWTYERIFELLLRLRANTIWPAMHEGTVPFYFVKGNREMAEKYGIVVGTSHCEPLMRNSAVEWDVSKYGAYNYLTNKEKMLAYWRERLEELGHAQNFYTIGLRGMHDGRMQGVKTLDEETEVLGEVIADQRNLLANVLGKRSVDLPQCFVPYKEVLKAYDHGLQLPEDVTLVWCDDNHGHITRLSDPAEQKRKGGAGVYYHISYWGKPHDYLWLASTQPALIYAEMKRAWDYGARKLWILNVGDIKPSEYCMNLFLDMAWNIDTIAHATVYAHQYAWLSSVFGDRQVDEIHDVMKEYYRLAGQRKPEHMGWNRVEDGRRAAVENTQLNPFVFGDEIEHRLKDYGCIVAKSEKIYAQIPKEKKPAYFELVHYPVCASAAMNQKWLYAQKARLFASYGLPVAKEYVGRAQAAYGKIATLSYTYNQDLLNGKWEGMMDMKPRDLPVFQEPALSCKESYPASQEIWLWVENDTVPLSSEKEEIVFPIFDRNSGKSYFISIFSKGESSIQWSVVETDGMKVEEIPTGLLYEKKLAVSLKTDALAGKRTVSARLIVNGKKYDLKGAWGEGIQPLLAHVERDGMIALNAADVTNVCRDSKIIEGLGHSGRVIGVPVVKGKISSKSPCLSYTVYTHSLGTFSLRVGAVPFHPANKGDLRYAVVIDRQSPKIVSIKADFLSEQWAENVLRNQSVTVSQHKFDTTGEHTIRLYALDEDVYFDQLMIDFMPDRKFYLFPVAY